MTHLDRLCAADLCESEPLLSSLQLSVASGVVLAAMNVSSCYAISRISLGNPNLMRAAQLEELCAFLRFRSISTDAAYSQEVSSCADWLV
jgi:hypothetical protein